MSARVFFSGASLVLPDRLDDSRTLVVEDGRVVDFVSGPRDFAAGEVRVHVPGGFIVPGFVDVHVHGIAGHDVLTAGGVAEVAARLPSTGVTSFCPTSIACESHVLAAFLGEVGAARQHAASGSARVLGAHLESNFINPVYAGAQPLGCLRTPARAIAAAATAADGKDIVNAILAHRADIAVVTIAPELDGGMALLGQLVAAGVRVSLGHSGASFDDARAAIEAGASHATHLFNRMPPLLHRAPGLAGAVLASDAIAAELICDGQHVHPAMIRMTLAAKGSARVMAITDGTAGSGLPRGSHAALGGLPITVGDVAMLGDGTLAGSVATMNQVFATLVARCGLGLREASEICSATPARELGLVGFGVIATGAIADLAILDANLAPVQTWIQGQPAWSGTSTGRPPSR